MKYIFTILLSTIALSLLGQNPSKEQFDSLLVRAKIDFIMPDSCQELAIDYMRKIPHNYAVGPKDSSSQIRYYVRPLDTWVAAYDKKSKKEREKSMHPDALCKSMMMLAVLDASGNKTSDYQASLYPELTKEAYNADWGRGGII